MKPLVSICMPTYNGSKHISEAIESILNQSFSNFELLIIDDGSSDDTVSIIKSFSDDRIRFIQNVKNCGLVGNWNRCLSEAKGSYIRFLFQDDIMSGDSLEKQVDAFRGNSMVSLCFGASCVINDQGRVTMRRRPFKRSRIFNGDEIMHRSFRTYNFYGEPSNVMFSMSASKRVGSFDDSMTYAPDWDYWLRLSSCGDVAYVDEELSRFRVNTESMTGKLFQEDSARLKKDDAFFIEAVSKRFETSISNVDVLLHKVSVTLRTFGKRIYFLIHR